MTAIAFTCLAGEYPYTIYRQDCTHVVATAANAASYNMGFSDMTRDLNCTQFRATIGLSLYTLGFALTPLVTASFSEEFGRQPLYIVSCFGFALMQLMTALYVHTHSPAALA